MGSHGTIHIFLVDITKPTHHMPKGILFLPKPSHQGKVISPPSSSNNFSANGRVWTSKIYTIYSIHILHLYAHVFVGSVRAYAYTRYHTACKHFLLYTCDKAR